MLKSIARQILSYIGLITEPEIILVHSMSQPPLHSLEQGKIVLVGNKSNPKWAVLMCPGGCGLTMRLPLNKGVKPSWSVGLGWLGCPTAIPSVHQKNGCRAHFWIRKGKIHWCKDSGCGPYSSK